MSIDNKQIWDKNWSNLAKYSTNSAGNLWAFYLIEKVLKKADIGNGIILDAGCGMGNKSAKLASLFPDNKVIGVDFSDKGIEFANQYYTSFQNLEFRCCDARDVKESEKIEMISAFELLEHIDDWRELLKSFCYLSDKYVLISTPTGRMRKYEHGIGHYRNFRKGEIESFMKMNGYKKVDALYAGFPFWSPITRDITEIHSRVVSEKDKRSSELVISYNPFIHKMTYFVYRYLTFDRIGDQFMGLFVKEP